MIYFVLAGLIVIFALIFGKSLKEVPANPPHIAERTFLGHLIVRGGKTMYKNSGLRIFWLDPWLYGFIPINMSARNLDFNPEGLKTPEDNVELIVTISLTYRPDPEHADNFLKAGGSGKEIMETNVDWKVVESGIFEILNDFIPSEIREIISSEDQEPKTWEDALKKQPMMNEKMIKTVYEAVMETTIADDEVKKQVILFKSGKAELKMTSYGIIISRLDLKPLRLKNPKLAEESEEKAREKQQRRAESYDSKTVLNLTKTLQGKKIKDEDEDNKGSGENDTDKLSLTDQEALETVMIKQGKITKNVNVSRYEASPEIIKAVENIGVNIGVKIAEMMLKNKKGDSNGEK